MKSDMNNRIVLVSPTHTSGRFPSALRAFNGLVCDSRPTPSRSSRLHTERRILVLPRIVPTVCIGVVDRTIINKCQRALTFFFFLFFVIQKTEIWEF